jgi:hypothetical protein
MSIEVTLRFTMPHLKRDWFIHAWSNRWYDSGFCGVRLLGVDFQFGWWDVRLLRKEKPMT